MPLDPNSINTAIRSVITTLLMLDPTTMRPANQNAPTGNQAQPFGTVLITECDPVGQDSHTYENKGIVGQLTETISGQRHVICDVQFFRALAYSNASRLNALLRSDSASMLLQSKGLGFVRISQVRNLTEEIDTYWEERAQVQLEFYYSSTETLTIPTFASVVINIETETQSNSREVNLDVNP